MHLSPDPSPAGGEGSLALRRDHAAPAAAVGQVRPERLHREGMAAERHVPGGRLWSGTLAPGALVPVLGALAVQPGDDGAREGVRDRLRVLVTGDDAEPVEVPVAEA